ncbi:MAG: hypothetical protein L6R35_001220 [Caloplaca aegaea]|nr:MAG: hypothetical protein L6R35_001220 [Caloplaca aegaea]
MYLSDLEAPATARDQHLCPKTFGKEIQPKKQAENYPLSSPHRAPLALAILASPDRPLQYISYYHPPTISALQTEEGK